MGNTFTLTHVTRARVSRETWLRVEVGNGRKRLSSFLEQTDRIRFVDWYTPKSSNRLSLK